MSLTFAKRLAWLLWTKCLPVPRVELVYQSRGGLRKNSDVFLGRFGHECIFK